jgi:hypothetical protein
VSQRDSIKNPKTRPERGVVLRQRSSQICRNTKQRYFGDCNGKEGHMEAVQAPNCNHTGVCSVNKGRAQPSLRTPRGQVMRGKHHRRIIRADGLLILESPNENQNAAHVPREEACDITTEFVSTETRGGLDMPNQNAWRGSLGGPGPPLGCTKAWTGLQRYSAPQKCAQKAGTDEGSWARKSWRAFTSRLR